jgi:hypothetical protein
MLNFQSPTAVYIKLIANLKRRNATPTTQNILYVQTFKLNNVVNETDLTTMNINPPCSGCAFPLPAPPIPEYQAAYLSRYPENIIFRAGDTLNLTQANMPTRYTWGSLIVQANVAYNGTEPLTIWCPGGVVYENGATPIPPNITIITDVNYNNMSCLEEMYPTADPNFIQSACATTYKSQSTRWSKAEKVNDMAVNDIKIEAAKSDLFSAYPNPANNEVTIRYTIEKQGNVEISITDMLGRVIDKPIISQIHHTGTYEVKFNTSSLSEGMYFYHLKTDGINTTKKLMIVR